MQESLRSFPQHAFPTHTQTRLSSSKSMRAQTQRPKDNPASQAPSNRWLASRTPGMQETPRTGHPRAIPMSSLHNRRRDDAQVPVFDRSRPPIPHSVIGQLRRREESSPRRKKPARGGTDVIARLKGARPNSAESGLALRARRATVSKCLSDFRFRRLVRASYACPALDTTIVERKTSDSAHLIPPSILASYDFAGTRLLDQLTDVLAWSTLCGVDSSWWAQSIIHREEVAMEKLIARSSYWPGIACLVVAVIWRLANVLRPVQPSAATGVPIEPGSMMHASILFLVASIATTCYSWLNSQKT